MFLEFEDTSSQRRLAGTGWPHQENRLSRSHGDMLDLLDHRVERLVPSRDSALQKDAGLLFLHRESSSDVIITGQVKVDDGIERWRPPGATLWWGSLNEAAGKMARFRK